jgi:Putative beta-lactamase-inhibitor-like, PepSY-like
MKKFIFSLSFLAGTMTSIAVAQDLQSKDVPEAVKTAFTKKYPDAKKVSWEKEKGNYEANWGGKSGEDSSVTFTPSSIFVEIVIAIPVSQLPSSVAPYVNNHYKGAKIREAGKVTDAAGRQMYEAEIKGKDLIFDENGVFIKED